MLSNVYIPPGRFDMTKRLIDLDDDLLAAAQKELNTSGVSDTVRLALQHAAALSARRRQVAWLQEGGLEDMADAEQRDDVWR
jgi:Arc/MetJ family transcription regulator